MKVADIYKADESAVAALIAAYPLALVISGGDVMVATPLPILLESHGGGARLLGHFARGNPHVKDLRRNPRALFVFQGPQGYISPSWMTDRTQAPTWNFATVHISADVEFLDGPESAREAVERLTEQMEFGRPKAWSASELGGLYDRLVRGVIAFRASVVSIEAKFKLGQNERLDVLTDILDGLGAAGHDQLRAAMVGANAERLAHAAAAAPGGSGARIGV